MNRVVVEGYQGGKVLVNECAHLFAFFSQRYETGAPCQVMLGPVLDVLLTLKPGEHLQEAIEGIDDISVREVPAAVQGDPPEVALVIRSSYWHSIDMIVVSQERLRQAARWASFSAQWEVGAAR